MRLEPQHGQDIPTEASEVILTFAEHRLRIVDLGHMLKIEPLTKNVQLYGGHGDPLYLR